MARKPTRSARASASAAQPVQVSRAAPAARDLKVKSHSSPATAVVSDGASVRRPAKAKDKQPPGAPQGKGTAAALKSAASAPAPQGVTPAAPVAKAPRRPDGGRFHSAAEARQDLLERSALNVEGAVQHRSDPLADAQAARRVIERVTAHGQELARRGLSPHYCDAALQLAGEIEQHLQALPAAALAARGRSPEQAELLADAATTAQAVREAILRVTRGADGRAVAHAFGVGEPFNARQPAHVLRAVRHILEAARAHPGIASDAGLLEGDLETLRGLATELEGLPGAAGAAKDEARDLQIAQGALRAFFDLVAAKAMLAMAADPEERTRLLALLPRLAERRHRHHKADAAPAA